MLKLEVIHEPERLHEIAGAWRSLADSLDVTPFQLPDWQLAWWHHFGSGRLSALTFWQERHLVGLLPLFLHEWQGRRQLTLLGSGVTDYLEPCVSNVGVYEQLNAYLRVEPNWDVCDWQDLSAGTPLQHLYGLAVDAEADTPCSAIALDGTFDEYWQKRSADLRRNIKRYARRAEAEAPLRFSVLPVPAPALLNDLIRLHGERWQRRGETGMVEVNQSAGFLRSIATFDSCRLFQLEWHDGVVAVTAGFLRGQTVFSYLSAFDPVYEILGFGRYLLYSSLRWAFENGYRRWDFLRGDESYKASWGAVQVPKCRVRIKRS